MSTSVCTFTGLHLLDNCDERLEASRAKISANFEAIDQLFQSDVFDERYYTKTEIDSALSSLTDKVGTPIASASITSVGSPTSGDTIHITGVNAILSLGTTTRVGIKKTLVFDASLVLTHDATKLILPTGVNITTQAGDIAEFQCEDGTNGYWRCLFYTRKSGQPLIVPEYSVNGVTLGSSTTIEERISTMAGATSITIGAVGTAENLTVTGANSISSLGNCLGGVRRKLLFTGINVLTHNATSLILPDATNITTASGDVAEFLCISDNNWKLTSYLRAVTPASANSIKWNGASKTVSTSAPSGGVDGDIWFQY